MAEFIGIVVGILVLAVLFKPFFGDFSAFFECVRFWFTPDLFSMFRGEWMEDTFAEMKLGLWIVCGAGAGFLTYSGIAG